MSRFVDYDDYDDTYNGGDLWTHRAHLALSGKRGRKALGELRDALLALPEKRLIEGALCTVGLRDRLSAMPEIVPGQVWDQAKAEYVDGMRQNYERIEIAEFIEEHPDTPEGVCAIGAYVWHQKVKAGMDPAEAFAALPMGHEDAEETVDAGRAAGLTYTLAWELANRNDETWGGMTPEDRYVAFLRFIDTELARPPLTKPVPKPNHRRRAKPASGPESSRSPVVAGLGL